MLCKEDVIVIAPNHPQYIVDNKDCEGVVFNFTEEFIMDYEMNSSHYICSEIIYKFYGNNRSKLLEESFFQVQSLVEVLKAELKRPNYSNQKFIIQNLLSTILIYIQIGNERLDQKTENQLILVMNFKKEIANGVKHHYDVQYYADKLNVSIRTLQIATKNVLNISPKDVIAKSLILESKRSLLNSELMIKEIAFDLGFVDTAVFSKFFKKHTSLTPLSFRNNHV